MSRVLVVEDEMAIAELIALNLRHAGFEVTVVDNGEDAQTQIDKVMPDLVLLDWMLPGQSGLTLAKRWRGATRTRDIPIIMLTARAQEADPRPESRAAEPAVRRARKSRRVEGWGMAVFLPQVGPGARTARRPASALPRVLRSGAPSPKYHRMAVH